MHKIEGMAVILGDNVDTDQILPGFAMAEPCETIGQYAMAGLVDINFSKVAEPGCILVAGRNFGCGSSREQAPIALKQAGVALVVAVGFARIFRRNAINIGLPVFKADLIGMLGTGEHVCVQLDTGLVIVEGRELRFNPLPDNVLTTLRYGGLIPRVRAELKIGGQ